MAENHERDIRANEPIDEDLVYRLKLLQGEYEEKPSFDDFLQIACQRIRISVSEEIVRRVYNMWPTFEVDMLQRAIMACAPEEQNFPTKKAHQLVKTITNNIDYAIYRGRALPKENVLEILLATALKVRQGSYNDIDHVFFTGVTGGGKSILGNLLFSDLYSYWVPSDFTGVGVYDGITGLRRVLKNESAPPKFFSSAEHVTTLLQMRRSNWSSNKEDGTPTRACISYVTSNCNDMEKHIKKSGCSWDAIKRKSLIISTQIQLEDAPKWYKITDLGVQKLLLRMLIKERFSCTTVYGSYIREQQQFLEMDIAADENYQSGNDEDPDLSEEEERFEEDASSSLHKSEDEDILPEVSSAPTKELPSELVHDHDNDERRQNPQGVVTSATKKAIKTEPSQKRATTPNIHREVAPKIKRFDESMH